VGPAIGLAEETPRNDSPPPKKSLYLRVLNFLRNLEQTVIAEIIALTSPKDQHRR
jgi:hypothetical protein